MAKRFDINLPSITADLPDIPTNVPIPTNIPTFSIPSLPSLTDVSIPSLPSFSIPSLQSLGADAVSDAKKAAAEAAGPSPGLIAGVVVAVVVPLFLVPLLWYLKVRKFRKRVGQVVQVYGS
jgi:hypothetical protein